MKGKILIVDDTSNNLRLLNKILSGQGYFVRCAPSGAHALTTIGKELPELILLDIMMPEMDGYEVCKRLKANKHTADIPIIFVTALNEHEDEARGFELGAVDYITKPYNSSIIIARVKTHLELQNSYRKQKELLENTVAGVISLLADILSLAYPDIFKRACRIRNYVSAIARHLKLPNAWQYKLAGLLSQIGCITLSSDILIKSLSGVELSEEEQRLFEKHPQVGNELIMRIPHLKKIAAMIALQNKPVDDLASLKQHGEVLLGGKVLKVVIDFDRMTDSGASQESVIRRMRTDSRQYDTEIVNALQQVIGTDDSKSKVIRDGNDLCPGMTLVEDVYTSEGLLLLSKGYKLTVPAIIRLKYYISLKKLSSKIEVQ